MATDQIVPYIVTLNAKNVDERATFFEFQPNGVILLGAVIGIDVSGVSTQPTVSVGSSAGTDYDEFIANSAVTSLTSNGKVFRIFSTSAVGKYLPTDVKCEAKIQVAASATTYTIEMVLLVCHGVL